VNVQASVDFQTVVGRAETEFGRFRISDIRFLDGMKLIFKDQSWIMFRLSGTEPKVRVYCESRDQVRLGELLDVASKVLQESAMMNPSGVRRGQ